LENIQSRDSLSYPRIFNSPEGFIHEGVLYKYAHTIFPNKFLGTMDKKDAHYVEIYMFPDWILFTKKEMKIFEAHIGLFRYEKDWKKIKNEIPLFNPD